MTELEPFCVFFDHAQPPMAMWQPAVTAQPAVALFSTSAKAETYAQQSSASSFRVAQLSERELVRLLAELFAQGVTHAALDPDAASARSLFDLRLVLKSARQRLQTLSTRTSE